MESAMIFIWVILVQRLEDSKTVEAQGRDVVDNEKKLLLIWANSHFKWLFLRLDGQEDWKA